jgi:GT2 family glycosyltransferase
MYIPGNNIPAVTQSPQVAVVILNWNGQKYLQQFLPSLLASTYPYTKIYVADNASTDDSVTYLQNNFPQVQLVLHTANYGFAKGYNEALQKITADYYVLLNSDVEVTPNWIEPVIHLMENDKAIAACQPKLCAYTHRQQFEYAGACGGWIDMLGYPFARGRVFDRAETDEGQYNTAQACFWASGAALFVRASLYHQVGGLDEYFFAHQEEIDLCWRLQLAGFKVMVQPASVVYHVGGGTLPKQNNFKVYLNFRNNLVMMVKNKPASQLWWQLPLRLVLDVAAAAKELLTGNTGYFTAVLKAQLHFVQWILLHQKKSVFPRDKHGTLQGVYHGSVVWQHFVKKKTKFSEIVTSK